MVQVLCGLWVIPTHLLSEHDLHLTYLFHLIPWSHYELEGTANCWVSWKGHFPSTQSPWLHVTASERFLPRATFLPITTLLWVFQACRLCINTLNFYGLCSTLSINHRLHPSGFKEGLGSARGCECTWQSQDRLGSVRLEPTRPLTPLNLPHCIGGELRQDTGAHPTQV